MLLTRSQRILLNVIYAHDGLWNWYKLGNYCLGRIESPAEFELKELRSLGLIESKPFENEPLPRLFVTDLGRMEIRASDAQVHDDV